MKNQLIEILIRYAQKRIPKHPSKHRFLIVSTTALGDTLWGAPAIENLRSSFPDAYIAVLTSPIGLEVLSNNPHIDQMFLLKEPLARSFFSLRNALFRECFDTVLLFHASQRLTLPLCALIGASRIVGTFGINKGLDTLLTHSLPNLYQHEITRRLEIARAVGAKISQTKPSFFLKPEERLPQKSQGPWIALHPGSSDAYKRWPASHFIQLGQMLKENISCEILVTGSPSEYALMKEIASKIPGAYPDNPHQSLRAFAAVLAQMDLLISNDTGPAHLAHALNRPVIGIYAATDPAVCGPSILDKSVTISKRATCEPCLKRKCKSPFCFLQISPEEVFFKASQVLQKQILTP